MRTPVGAEFDEPDLRAEDDALVAAALEAEAEEEDEAEEDQAEPDADADADDDDDDNGDKPRKRRRGRRGGRGRRKRPGALEGTFDHGDEGYGLWLDPAVQDDPVYAEHWAGHRPVTVVVEPERIVITRSGEDDPAPSCGSTRLGRVRTDASYGRACVSRARPPAKSDASRA